MICPHTPGCLGRDKTRTFGRLLAAILLSLLAAPAWAAVGFDRVVTANVTTNSTTAASPVFSTNAGNELLLAFISTDYISGPNTEVTGVTGGGLTWVLVVRTNDQAGTSEIWRAFATTPLTNVTVTATMSQPVQSSITVMTFIGVETSGINGAGAIGATGSGSAFSGAPSATLVTTRNDSMVLGVGNDYDNAIARTVGANQVIMSQNLTSVGDTYWVQRKLSPVPAGTSVTINDTAPATDRYNLSVVEVLPAPGPQFWTMSGTVSPAVSGNATLLFIGGALVSTYADSNGNYSFTGMPNGTYTITPSKPGFTFTPANRTVTVNGGNVTGLDFTAQGVATSWSLSGNISPAAGGSLATVSLGGGGEGGRIQSADSSGNFTFNGLANGTYTVVPSKPGYTFSPASRTLTINGADVIGVNFTATPLPQNWSLSGTVGPAGVGGGTVLSIPIGGVSTVADSSGHYSFTGLVPNGTFNVIPSKPGYTFSPPNRLVTVNGADVTGVDFTAIPIPTTFTVSGTISPAASGSGAYMVLSGGVVSPVIANSFGQYSFAGVPTGTYTVTPTRYGYAFSPTNRVVIVNGANVTGVDFTATAVPTSFTITGTISPAWAGAGTRLTMGESGDVIADSNGNYTITNVPVGTTTVIPSKTGFGFSPTARQVTSSGETVTGVDFVAEPDGLWTSPFDLGLIARNMVMMHTGKVLMYSGDTQGPVGRVWEPSTGSLTPVPNPNSNVSGSGHSQLADGRILFAGGYDAPLGAANANIFDPVTLTWSATPENMAYRRWHPTATALPDGRTLITSGAQDCPTCLADVPEIFDPATGEFTSMPLAAMGVPYYPFMFVLPDGTVVNAGSNQAPVATSKLDVATKAWSVVDADVRDGHSAVMYEPGKIFKSGSAADSGRTGSAASTAYVLDMTQSSSWQLTAPMVFPRAFHNTTLLPDGNVLVTGGSTALDGYDVNQAVYEAELWSPATGTWQTLSRASFPRLYRSTALLLPDGRLLVAGGDNAVYGTRGQIFSPPYFFKGPRPTISSAPSTVAYGSTFTVTTPDAASIAKISLMRPGAVTHGFDQDQRLVSLAFTAGSGSLTVEAPANANLAPPGYYMLFLVSSAGVPSVASFVQLPAPGVDLFPPSAPTIVSADGGPATATLVWTASTDDTGVALYNVHRSTTPGFVPSPANRIAQPTTTTFTNAGLAAGTYYYLVTAQDVAGNVSDPSNPASVYVFPDQTPPTVAFTAPADQSTVSGTITVSASASDDIGVASVLFLLDGNPVGMPRPAPYTMNWNSTMTSNGAHTLRALATDVAGNTSTAEITIMVSNAAQIPAGLVAAYGFNEASGVQTADASGQGNIGTLSSATRTTAGKFGGALSFNGTNAWVTVADAASLDLTTGMTIEAWVRPSTITGWRTVALKEDANGLAYALYSGNGASRAAAYVHTGMDMGTNGTANMVLNTWTHLAMTYDGSTLRLFVNGVQVSTKAAPGAVPATGGALRIGGNAVWGEYFKGIIDEVRVYNRPLTATEIQTDMTTPIP